jgi:dynein heavy chain 1
VRQAWLTAYLPDWVADRVLLCAAGAIREYQEQLIATVKKDIQQLQTAFQQKYNKSEARRMSKQRDIPSVSGQIIWARQIQRQLNMYMSRIEDVLGRNWHHHVEGRQLQRECEGFKTVRRLALSISAD